MPSVRDPIGQYQATCWFAGAHFRLLHQSTDADAQEAFFPAGASTPLHRHTTYTELLLVIEGGLEAYQVGLERLIRAGPGDLITIPKRQPHAVLAGADGVHLVVISLPAGFASVVDQLGNEADTPGDPEEMARVTRAHGDEILGPPEDVPFAEMRQHND